MPLFMLDTNIVSYLIKGTSPHLAAKIQKTPMSHLVISSITEAEILYGVAMKPSSKMLAQTVKEFLACVETVPWGSEAAESYADLRKECNKAGKALSAMDLLIASHAIALGATLISHDRALKEIGLGLKTQDWTES